MDTILAADLFATKGLEYLLVIGFLVALVPFWILLTRSAGAVPAVQPVTAGNGSVGSPWFALGDGMFFHPGHAWVRRDGPDLVRVGLDDFAQKLLGWPTAISLPRVGDHLEQGGDGFALEVDHEAFDLVSPIGGEVVARNQEVLDRPHLLNEDPYGAGWLLEVRVPHLDKKLKNLLSDRTARAWMAEAESAVRERMAPELGPVMQDGGVPVSGFAHQLDPDHWQELARELLLCG